MLTPHIAPIHADPRFSGVMTTARGDFERAADILADARSRGGLPAFLEQPLAELLALRW
jgi:hypothetical protein